MVEFDRQLKDLSFTEQQNTSRFLTISCSLLVCPSWVWMHVMYAVWAWGASPGEGEDRRDEGRQSEPSVRDAGSWIPRTWWISRAA